MHKGASPDEWAREGTGTWQAMTCRIAFRDVESQALPCVVLLPASLPTISSHPVRARCVREPDATLRCRGGRPGDLLCRRARLHPPQTCRLLLLCVGSGVASDDLRQDWRPAKFPKALCPAGIWAVVLKKA